MQATDLDGQTWPSSTVTTAQQEKRTRIRENQRRSRERRRKYVEDLEKRIRSYEGQGIHASVELQSAARRVSEENKCLRRLLIQHGISDAQIEDYLREELELADDQLAPTVGNGSSRSAVETAEMLMQPRRIERGGSQETGAFDHRERTFKVEEDLHHGRTSLGQTGTLPSPRNDPQISSPWDPETSDAAMSPPSTHYSDEPEDGHFLGWHRSSLVPAYVSSSHQTRDPRFENRHQQLPHADMVSPPTAHHVHFDMYTGPPHGYDYDQPVTSPASLEALATHQRQSRRQTAAVDWVHAGEYVVIQPTNGEYHAEYPAASLGGFRQEL